jgi:phosphatidylserine synthase
MSENETTEKKEELAEAKAEIKAESKPEPKPVGDKAYQNQGGTVDITPASDFSILKAETSGPVVMGLMAVMGVIMFLSYKSFQSDYMLLFCGLFVFLGVYPSINVKVKNPNSKIILEVSIAFALCMGVFLLLKSMAIPETEHLKILIIFVTLLGMRYIFFPAYNVGVAEDQKASN